MATTTSPSRATRRRDRKQTDVGPNQVTSFPPVMLCMRVTRGFPYKVTYKHQMQGYGKRSCRRCGAPEKKTKKE